MIRPRLCSKGELYYSEGMEQEAKEALENWENFPEETSVRWAQSGYCGLYFDAHFEKLSKEKLELKFKDHESNIADDELAKKCSLECPKCRNITRLLNYNEGYSYDGDPDDFSFLCKDCKMHIKISEGNAKC